MRTDVIFNTDAASGLGRLPDNFIDCIVASPPYWQLRDYGLSPILLGGRQKCEHDFDDYAICRSCGGWLGQLGQEPSREMFLEHGHLRRVPPCIEKYGDAMGEPRRFVQQTQ